MPKELPLQQRPPILCPSSHKDVWAQREEVVPVTTDHSCRRSGGQTSRLRRGGQHGDERDPHSSLGSSGLCPSLLSVSVALLGLWEGSFGPQDVNRVPSMLGGSVSLKYSWVLGASECGLVEIRSLRL